jgi:hypothetical protein
MTEIRDETWFLQESLRPPVKPDPRPTSVTVVEMPDGSFERFVTGLPVPDPVTSCS